MTAQADQITCCSQKISAILMCSIQEIIGEKGLLAVLKQSSILAVDAVSCRQILQNQLNFEEVGRIHSSLEVLLGAQGGRGVALRSGRAMFRHFLREFGTELGFADLAFRLSSTEVKLFTGAEVLAHILSTHMNMEVKVESSADQLVFMMTRCAVCWEREADTPVCHLIIGMLQELAYWVSGGKVFLVEEKKCVARGDTACVVVINPKSIE